MNHAWTKVSDNGDRRSEFNKHVSNNEPCSTISSLKRWQRMNIYGDAVFPCLSDAFYYVLKAKKKNAMSWKKISSIFWMIMSVRKKPICIIGYMYIIFSILCYVAWIFIVKVRSIILNSARIKFPVAIISHTPLIVIRFNLRRESRKFELMS